MNTKDIDNAINHIISLQEKLSTCENNLQYIKRLQALKYWLHKFDSLLDRTSRLNGEYAAILKVTSMPVLDFHSMTGFIIPSYHTNMEIDRSNSVGHPHLGVQLT